MTDLAPPAPDSLPVTPGTRSEAEAAFLSNILAQTSSAGQAPPSTHPRPAAPITGRPAFPTRSSHNYADAAGTAASDAPPPRPRAIKMPTGPGADDLAAQNEAAERAWMSEQAAAERGGVGVQGGSSGGVLGLAGPGAGPDFPAVQGARQGWSAQDMKRRMQGPLMGGGSEGAVYGYSGQGGGATGA